MLNDPASLSPREHAQAITLAFMDKVSRNPEWFITTQYYAFGIEYDIYTHRITPETRNLFIANSKRIRATID